MDKFETHDSSIDYGSNGMILIASFVVLLVACFVVVLFHVYGPCFQGCRLNRNHRLNASTGGTAVVVIASPQGLDACAMHAIPTFIYESKGHQESPRECAVCLSEFEIGEMGRVLPECQHCFHVDCIDMWLRSHSDCPLCRAQVKVQSTENPVDQPVEDPNEISVFIHESGEMGYRSSIGLNSTCQSGGIQIASSSSKTPEGPGKLPCPMNRDPTNSEVGSDSIPNSGLDIESGLVSPVTSRVIKKLHLV